MRPGRVGSERKIKGSGSLTVSGRKKMKRKFENSRRIGRWKQQGEDVYSRLHSR